MSEPLTPRQRDILGVITRAVERTGQAPTLTAIGQELGGIAPPSVYKHILALEHKGFIRRHPNRRPPIELLTPLASAAARHMAVQVRLAGCLQAGRLITFAADAPEEVSVEPTLLAGTPGAVALRIAGFDLAGEGLFDGDLLLVAPGAQAAPGATVVALLDDAGATVRRYFPETDAVRLTSAQPAGETLVQRRVAVFGTVLAAIRRYA